MNSQLEAIDAEVVQVEQAIANMTPRVEELRVSDGELRHSIKQLLAKQQSIHAKQARLTRFANKSERDQWLQSEINDLQGNLTVRNNQVEKLSWWNTIN